MYFQVDRNSSHFFSSCFGTAHIPPNCIPKPPNHPIAPSGESVFFSSFFSRKKSRFIVFCKKLFSFFASCCFPHIPHITPIGSIRDFCSVSKYFFLKNAILPSHNVMNAQKDKYSIDVHCDSLSAGMFTCAYVPSTMKK